MDSIAQDRREMPRFALRMRLHYRVLHGARVTWLGVGHTSDFSRKAVRFVTPRRLPLDQRVELVIDWPIRFGEIYPMDLYAVGTIVRSLDGEAVARVTHWQFRVTKGAAEPERVGEPVHGEDVPDGRDLPASSYM